MLTHTKSKVHKRRLKELKEGAYTQEEAERAAGLTTDNKQRGVEEVVRRFEGAAVSGIEKENGGFAHAVAKA